MKDFHGIKFGGIEQKIFNLVLITIILMVGAFAAVIFHQSGQLTEIVHDAKDSQQKSINEISGTTMTGVLDANLTQSTQMQAYIAESYFGDAVRVVNIIADYTEKLFADPTAYSAWEVSLPDKEKNGEVTTQLLTEENIDLSDPELSAKIGLIGNLSNLMTAVYADSNVDSCYAALPDGAMILVDNHSATKFDENGDIIPIPIRERVWYTGAVEAGKLYFTDISSDLFTGQISIMCSLPVYCDDQLVAVIGADLFLNDVSAAVNNTERNGSFICLINQNGHILFSPQTEGFFRVLPAGQAQDIRTAANEDFADFVNDALESNTDLRLIEVEGIAYYVAGAPVKNVGWAVLSVVPKSLADQPAVVMLDQFNEIQENATETFNKGMSNAQVTFIVLMVIVFLLATVAAVFLSKRIVKPLNSIANRVISLGGNDLQFFMEDKYRTHDEIEVLAESFAKLSAKTIKYISEVQRVTAEKERIGTELALATRIQADMLPNIYPAFPERKEFDIYASMTPAREVGGDFYDFFLVDDDHLCFLIADVSGKGVPAALFMMASRIILASNAKLGKSPAEILTLTNETICQNNREEMFVTVWLGILEISTGKLTAANAGHEYPVLRKPNGRFELVKDKHGFVIGGMPGIKYKEYELQMEPGSGLFVYTDGVPEANNAENELFGVERMLEALNVHPEASAEEMLTNVRSAVDGFVKDAEQFDDLTMLGFEYKGDVK